MPAVAALLESPSAVQALRRSLPRGSPRVVSCRSPNALRRVLTTYLVDAVVLSPSESGMRSLAEIRRLFPQIPVVAFAPFRPDDGDLLLTCHRQRVAMVLVQGVDDAVAGELVLRCSATAERRRALGEAARVLRLTDPLQLRVWNLLLEWVDQPIRTADLAHRLHVSREHLSRQFGAGGAPNLKRVIDLTRVACAAQMALNPGYEIGAIARILHFASSSHLSSTVRRIAGIATRNLPELGPRGVLAAFARGNTRSRLR